MVKPIKRIESRLDNKKTTYIKEKIASRVTPKNFNIQNEAIKNDVLVTNKLLFPAKTELPTFGTPGQIVFNNADNTFYGWNGSEWVSFTGGNESFEKVALGEQQSIMINPNVNKTLITGISGKPLWATHSSGVTNDLSEYINMVSLNNLDMVATTVTYDSDPLNVYNGDRSFAFSLPFSAGAIYETAIIRYEPSGTAHCVGKLGGTFVEGISNAINDNNHIIVAGEYYETLMVYSGDMSLSFQVSNTEAGHADAYLIKYGIDGGVKWFSRIVGKHGLPEEINYACGINSSNESIVACTSYADTVNIYNSDGSVAMTITLQGYGDSFLVKYTDSGFVDWAAKGETNITGNLSYNSLHFADNGDIVVCGRVTATFLTFYNKNNTVAATFSNMGDNGLLFKYAGDGNFDWAILFESAYVNDMYKVSRNTLGTIYVSGFFLTDLSVYNANGSFATTIKPVYDNQQNILVMKYNSVGEYQWGAVIATPVNYGYYNMACATNDNDDVLVCSSWSNELLEVYNSDRTLAFTIAGAPSTFGYIVKYDPDGNACWTTKIGENSLTYSIAMNNLNHLVVTGEYASSQVNVYDSNVALFETISNEGAIDSFIVKYIDNYTAQFGDVLLGTPVNDGQIKRVVSNGPLVKITTADPINQSYSGFNLQQYQSIRMIWDATNAGWIVVENDSKLV